MAPETSQFESSEMLATFLASTPLLEETWRLCSHANAASQRSFAVNVVGQVAYVAFSGVQAVAWNSAGDGDANCGNLVELESLGKGLFSTFPCHVEGKGAVMVHAGLLQLFLSFYETQDFQQQMLAILNQCKSVVFTGHSLGGPLASLSALWLLSNVQTSSPTISVLSITYGSPLLGNESFSQAILQERWAGNFCHIVAHHDILPRLLFAPSSPFIPHLRALFQFWQLSMTSPYFVKLVFQLSDEEKVELVEKVLACVEGRLNQGDNREIGSPYWPFGSYMFCSGKGAICLDNAVAIVKFLYLTMAESCSSNSCIEDHLKYEEYVGKVCWQYLQKGNMMMKTSFSESSSEAGIALALQSSGISCQQPVYETATNSLATARQSGWRRNLNNAKMAVSLSKITPFRAEIEWYKAFCDNSEDQLGYYDSFKRRGAKRDFKVNMNRLRLGRFWDDLIDKLEKNQLTHDFHKLPKYVNASHFYKLLVEPLEIAEYYRTGKHIDKGHYIEHGREKRFKIFDKWWGERKVGDEESKPRSKYAGLTQDSCFWARVEEARELIFHVVGELDLGRRLVLLEKIEKFEEYASGMIERKEVSIDVMAKNSSYSLLREEWRGIKSQLKLMPPLPGFQDGMVQ